MDVFHEGEGLVPARLLLQGDFPWRDFIWAHGLLEDTYRDVIGMLLFDKSRWGATAGFTLILFPLYCVFLYMLFIYLFGKSWPLLVAGAILFFSQFSGPAHFRFIFWPLVLLLLAAVLNKASPIRTAAFTVALFVEAIITPEAVFTLPGCGAVIVLYEVSHFRRDRNLLSNFRRTVGCLLVGLVLTMAFAVYLVTHGALQAFLDYYRINSQGHAYTGGLAFGDYLRTSVNPNLDIFAVVAPVMALAVALWYAVLKLHRHDPFTTPDWIMGASAIFVLLYYQKFLARADGGHLYQSYAVAVPLLFYIVFKTVTAGEAWFRRRSWGALLGRYITRYPLALTLLVIVGLTTPGLADTLDHTPMRYRAVAAQPAWLPQLGYARPDAFDASTYRDLDQILRRYLNPGDQIFDFANEPGLYFYLLDYRPATRYYHISLAMPDDTQQDVVRRLSQSRPKILVFSDDRLGLPVWDHIPNMVRHYEVSQYILDHYKPLGVVDGQVLFAAVDADVPQISTLGIAPAEALVTDNVYFHIAQCDWGYAPNFLSVSPSQSEESFALNVPLRDAAGSTLPASTTSSIQISLPAGEEWTKYRWLEIDAPSGFHGDHWALSDTGRTDPLRQVSFDTLDDSPHRIRVRVGSCAQWHGYKSPALLLQHSQAQEVSAVRLIP